MKKALAITLALILCLSALPMTALAEDDFVIENGVLVAYTGPGGDVVIPEGVTEIGAEAFAECEDMTSVVIPDSVTVIGNHAFAFCYGLTSVEIPSSVTVIGGSAFHECGGLTNVVIQEGVEVISGFAFDFCFSLTSVTLPKSLKTIEWHAFSNCDDLTDVYYGGSEEQWAQIDLDDEGNAALLNATIHFSDAEPEPEPETPDEPETPETDLPFADLESGAWYTEAITFAYENGLMKGVEDGKFDPNGITGRAQLMTVLARMDGADTEGGDVWYEKAMVWAMENGISDGSDPDGELTREQLATMLWRYAGKPETDAGYDAFTDAAGVHDWAAQAMAWAVEQGIINGDNGRLKPQDTATRAEMAAMLMRFCNSLEK